MKSKFKKFAVFFSFLTLININPCIAGQPLDSNQLKFLSFIGTLADQSDKGNLEAKFLLALSQYSISEDKEALERAAPANAVQAYLLASLYAANKNNSQFAYWIDQSKSLLQSHQLNSALSPIDYQSYTDRKLGLKILAFMGDVATEADKGNPEAETILKILNASFDKNYSGLVNMHPSTATEAYLVSSILLSQNKPEGYYFLDKARELIGTGPSTSTLSQSLPPIKFPPLPGASPPPVPVIGNAPHNALEEDGTQPGLGEAVDSTNSFSLPEKELARIESLASESEMSEDDKLLLDACRYFLGKGLPQNYELAAMNFTKLAEKGNPFAQAILGSMYHEGQGVPQNYYLAAEWYEKSIQNGNKLSYNNMGILHERGLGVPVNKAKAEQYYKNAIANEYNEAKEAYANLGDLYYQQHKYSLAEPLLVKASHLGVKGTDILLAQTYDAQKKYTLSFPLWKKVALRGKPLGMYNLAVSYANGEGTARSIVKAYYCAGMAQKKGYANAQALKTNMKRHLNTAQIKKLDLLIQENNSFIPDYI